MSRTFEKATDKELIAAIILQSAGTYRLDPDYIEIVRHKEYTPYAIEQDKTHIILKNGVVE